jgi:hypothetical protein
MEPRLYFVSDRFGYAYRCGHAYRFQKNIIGIYDCYFYDWKTGWFNFWEIGLEPHSPKTYDEAVELCTAHAKKYGYLKYVPHGLPGGGGGSGTALGTVAVITQSS